MSKSLLAERIARLGLTEEGAKKAEPERKQIVTGGKGFNSKLSSFEAKTVGEVIEVTGSFGLAPKLKRGPSDSGVSLGLGRATVPIVNVEKRSVSAGGSTTPIATFKSRTSSPAPSSPQLGTPPSPQLVEKDLLRISSNSRAGSISSIRVETGSLPDTTRLADTLDTPTDTPRPSSPLSLPLIGGTVIDDIIPIPLPLALKTPVDLLRATPIRSQSSRSVSSMIVETGSDEEEELTREGATTTLQLDTPTGLDGKTIIFDQKEETANVEVDAGKKELEEDNLEARKIEVTRTAIEKYEQEPEQDIRNSTAEVTRTNSRTTPVFSTYTTSAPPLVVEDITDATPKVSQDSTFAPHLVEEEDDFDLDDYANDYSTPPPSAGLLAGMPTVRCQTCSKTVALLSLSEHQCFPASPGSESESVRGISSTFPEDMEEAESDSIYDSLFTDVDDSLPPPAPRKALNYGIDDSGDEGAGSGWATVQR